MSRYGELEIVAANPITVYSLSLLDQRYERKSGKCTITQDTSEVNIAVHM